MARKLMLAIVSLFFFYSSAAHSLMKCEATHLGATVTVKKEMPLVRDQALNKVWESEFNGYYFSVNYDADLEDYLVMVIRAPDYKNAAVLRAIPNKQGILKASLSSAIDAAQVLCKEQ